MNKIKSPIIENNEYTVNLIQRSKEFMHSTLSAIQQIPSYNKLAEFWYNRYIPTPFYNEKIKEYSDLFDVPRIDIFGVNLCYDILMGIGSNPMGCSTLALSTSNGPILARNLDWLPASRIAKASVIVKEKINNKTVTNYGFIGMLGTVTAQTDNFAFCINAAYGGLNPKGWPVLLFLRDILLQANSFDEAVKMVSEKSLMTGCIITLVGTSNDQRVIIEKASDVTFLRKPTTTESPLIATNHYRGIEKPDDSCTRYKFLEKNIKELGALELLTNEEVMQNITAQHILMCPSTGLSEMYIPEYLMTDNSQNEITFEDIISFIQEM